MQKKIMIIEDDKGIGFFLKEALGEEGYNISVFESVEDAIPALSRDTDLIILDIKLPGMDGLTAIDLIKRITDIPVIISTAYGTRKNAQEAMKKGADDFFVKPVPLEELKVVVSRTIKRYEIKREIEIQKAKKYEDQQF
ncbi:MAG: response regulator, partial [Syntrophorhabdaceae bacterium]|nr:response regulator [Syntrophorhabdaceae bacterium]